MYNFSSAVYEAQIDILQREIEALKIENKRLVLQPFGFFSINNDEKVCIYYTGVSLDIFFLLEQSTKTAHSELPLYDGEKINILTYRDQFLLTLMKLRWNLDYMDLSRRFGISCTSVHRIFWSLLPQLYT
jgi:hypothetical protein